MNTLDALLVLPPMYQSGRMPDYNLKEPLGLMYINAVLKTAGYTGEILDSDILSLSIDQTVAEIIKKPASVIGFSVMQRSMPSIKLIIEKLRNLGVESYICCGGFAATLNAKCILDEVSGVDVIFLGEGEYTFSEFIRLIKNNSDWRSMPGIVFRRGNAVVMNEKSCKVNLDLLPRPSRELLSFCLEKTNYANILSSRGCYGSCSFCSNQAFEKMSDGPGWRGRNPKDVVDEIEDLRGSWGVKVFKFNDPNLFGPGHEGRQHVIDICKEIISRKINDLHLMGFCRSNDITMDIAKLMKAAGFERILIGIESSSATILKMLKKGGSIDQARRSIEIFRSVDIDIVPGFMVFNPYTTIETIKSDLSFLDSYGFSPILSKPLKIFNGTRLQEMMEAEGRLIWRNPFDGYHEYRIDPKVASIYMALKTMSVDWIDFFHKSYQQEIWAIKKSSAFKNRLEFDTLNGMVFAFEKDMLTALLNWIENGFEYRNVFEKVVQLKNQLIKIEQYIVSITRKGTILNTQVFSVSDLAFKIFNILSVEKFNTFPEQYRWNDD